MFGILPVRNSMLNESSAYGTFYNAIDNFFNDDFFNRPSLLAKGFRMDVKETDEAYIIEAELPGVAKDEIEISYNKDNLYIGTHFKEENTKNSAEEEKAEASPTLESKSSYAASETSEVAAPQKAEVTDAKPINKVRYLHQERRRISMQRAIYLPDINKEGIEAKLDSGILTVSVPKLKPSETEIKIQIQ